MINKRLFSNKHIINIIWLLIDKMFLILGGFIVSIIVARYLGPDTLGKLSFGVAVSGMAVAFSQWGSSHIIYNLAAKKPTRARIYIQYSLSFRVCAFLLFTTMTAIALYALEYDLEDVLFIVLVVISHMFLGLDTYQYYFNGSLNSRYNAIGSMLSKATSLALRLLLVLITANFWYFVIPYFIEGLICFFYKKNKFGLVEVNKGTVYAKSFFIRGLPLLVSVVCTFIYVKVNEFVLGIVMGFESLGIYTVAFTLSYFWLFLPQSVGITLISRVMQDKEENQVIGYGFVNLCMILLSIPIIVLLGLASETLVSLAYGDVYSVASSSIWLLSLSALCSTLTFINNRVLTSMKGGAQYLMKKVVLSSIISLGVSYYSVSTYGLVGAAYSILICEFLNLTLFNYFFNKAIFLKIHINMPLSLIYYRNYI
ncbi:oligosaccharide flippase family protein [Vibrio hannami]|uniref:oligosaccharide flippase family protein n=1 Tax=Vibrio hannami TaxID=2717094 RepID=UPI00240F9936|nr:oligosaccharide flippase family protein [Vibrio hannami]MDG3088257.1 oligosaccharide flippase family protein [Vibrio hannami]